MPKRAWGALRFRAHGRAGSDSGVGSGFTLGNANKALSLGYIAAESIGSDAVVHA